MTTIVNGRADKAANKVRLLLVACIVYSSIAPGCLSQTSNESEADSSLKMFLQHYLKETSQDNDKTTKYVSSFADLDDDGIKEAIVYITGRSWCGSGGCSTFVLAPKNSSFRVLAEITVTRPHLFFN